MCGRYNLIASPEEIGALFECGEVPDFPPRYNIAPTRPVAVIRRDHGMREFVLMRWGLLPSWARDPAALTLIFNARSESAAEKPAFRAAMRRRRCLIPATGFYEWQKVGKGPKRPHHIRRPDGGLFAPEDFSRWLDTGSNPPPAVADILQPVADSYFEAYPISPRVNSAESDDPDVVAPLVGADTPPEAPPRRRGKQDDAAQLPLF
jgi:putative SOS response-associated peptidase YedK